THDRVVAVRRRDRSGDPRRAIGRFPGLHGADALPELVPEHDDPSIRGPEVLEAVDGDRALTDLGLVVAGLPLTRLVSIGGELAGEHDIAICPPVRCDARDIAHVPELDEQSVGVVDGYDPTAHHWPAEGMLALAILPDRRDLLEVRQDVF